MLSKLLLYSLVASFLLLGLTGTALKIERSRLSKAKQANIELKQEYDNLNNQYKMYQTLQTLNATISSQYEKKTTESAAKEKTILSTVDKTTEQVRNHEITSTDADISYTHSMWDAYCQASPEDASNCPTK